MAPVRGTAMGLCLAALLAGVAPAAALPIVTADVVADSGGFTYSYTLSSDTPDQQVFQIVLFGLSGYDESSIASPAGWALATPLSPDTIAWTAIDPVDYASITHVVTGFSFRSTFGPGPGGVLTLFEPEDDEGNFFAFDTTVVPIEGATTTVPEPATWYLLLSGCAAIFHRRR
jgi:hypothetical protein